MDALTHQEGSAPPDTPTDKPKDYFVEENGVKFAGRHLLLDFWGAKNLGNQKLIEESMREGALASGATILHTHLKKFGDEGGVSGVLVLAESHISIHTWPERNFAAIDIFMCGSCNPHEALKVLKRDLQPEYIQLNENRRGIVT